MTLTVPARLLRTPTQRRFAPRAALGPPIRTIVPAATSGLTAPSYWVRRRRERQAAQVGRHQP